MSRLKTLLKLRIIKFLRFNLYLFISTNENLYFFKQTLSPSIFVFDPCQQPVDPWLSLVDLSWSVFIRFFCCLFVHVPWLVPITLTPLWSLFRNVFTSYSDFSNNVLLSRSHFRRAILVVDVPMFCQPHSWFLIIALTYGYHFHFVWWHLEHGNLSFHSLMFVHFLFILLYRLTICVYHVPMHCQPHRSLLNRSLYYGQLFQLIWCMTMHWNHTFLPLLSDGPVFKTADFVDDL